jgi:5-methylcytosine-specific restriction enzyme A
MAGPVFCLAGSQCPIRRGRATLLSTNRICPAAGWVDSRSLPRGPGGRALCRWCNTEVPRGRRSFCSGDCVHQHKLRSDPGYLRGQVFERDRGICAECGIDTEKLRRRLRRLPRSMRLKEASNLGIDPARSLWQADHVIPVVEGGGQCDLDNMRTLCIPCHKQATRSLMERRRNRNGSVDFMKVS